MNIPYSKPYYTGKEIEYIQDAMANNKLSGNGKYTKLCEGFLEKRYDIPKVLLTTSCTDALEICAGLLDIQPGDEVIVPSFTFVSTANAFALRGAKIVFIDSMKDHPNMDASLLKELITPKTKAIVPVHYAGYPCNMDKIMEIAKEYNIIVIEDAAQAIESTYKGKQLGTIGDLGTFSFHDTKNISSGEGGALLVNDSSFIKRAEIIREKGTNRAAFFRGEINKYGWEDLGSSHIISELNAAFLFAQLEKIEEITKARCDTWKIYYNSINQRKSFLKPCLSEMCNAHKYYLRFSNPKFRDQALKELNQNGIKATFHFLPLEKSDFAKKMSYGPICYNSLIHSQQILRLPLYASMNIEKQKLVIDTFNNLEFS